MVGVEDVPLLWDLRAILIALSTREKNTNVSLTEFKFSALFKSLLSSNTSLLVPAKNIHISKKNYEESCI